MPQPHDSSRHPAAPQSRAGLPTPRGDRARTARGAELPTLPHQGRPPGVPGTLPHRDAPGDRRAAKTANGAPRPVVLADNRGKASGPTGWIYRRLVRPWLTNWWFWAGVTAIGSSGVGLVAAALLLRIPALPNCPETFWPLAPGSVRLYCAELAANKETVDDLLEAIELVRSLPPDHELRPQANEYLQTWASQILDLADEAFQDGRLAEAVRAAERIPRDVATDQVIDDRVAQWRAVWQAAEEIYRDALDALDDKQWMTAEILAHRLRSTDNRHWATVKHEELKTVISQTRQDDMRLREAEGLLARGGLENLKKALELVREIEPERKLYAEAQRLVGDISDRLVALATDRLMAGDADAALEVASLLGDREDSAATVRDLETLAAAQRIASGGTAADLELAIAKAQDVPAGRPLYERALALTARWQQETSHAAYLDRARELARDPDGLQLAIAEAQRVPSTSSRYAEAQSSVRRWSESLQLRRDRPRLDRAEQIAGEGTRAALRSAIGQARGVGQSSPLYGEAQRSIDRWTDRLETLEDRPLLDRAREYASAGNYAEAIRIARRIGNGRALAVQAQADIGRWEARLAAQAPPADRARGQSRSIAEASPTRPVAREQPAPDSLAPTAPAQAELERRSQQLLQMARIRAGSDLPGAIALARRIPANSTAYAEAQRQIARWEALVQPPEPVSPPAIAPVEPSPAAEPSPTPESDAPTYRLPEESPDTLPQSI